jgi:hypothetical protein
LDTLDSIVIDPFGIGAGRATQRHIEEFQLWPILEGILVGHVSLLGLVRFVETEEAFNLPGPDMG